MEVRLAYNKRIMSSIALNPNFWPKNLNPSVSLLYAMVALVLPTSVAIFVGVIPHFINKAR